MIVQPKTITTQEKKLLVAALSEMKARGMKMPANFSMPMTRNDLSWGMNENGYFNKFDGTIYNPTKSQKDFISDNARFSLFRGARGCLSGDTVIGGTPIAERTIGVVDAIGGRAYASNGYLKGKANLFRVTTQSGFSVRATEHHRFLTPEGWLPLNLLEVGSLLLSDGNGRGVSRTGRTLDSLDCYSLGFHQYGELHDLLESASLNILRQLHTLDGDSGAWSDFDLLSIVDFCSLTLFRFVVEYSTGLISFQQSVYALQTLVQFLYTTVQTRKVEQRCLEETSFCAETSPLYQLLFQVFGEQNQCSARTILTFLQSVPESFQTNTIFRCLSSLDVSQGFVRRSDFLSSYRRFADNQSLTYDKFFSMSREIDEILYQQGIHSPFQELLRQSNLRLGFSSFVAEKQMLQKFLQLYVPDQRKSLDVLKSLLQFFLPKLLREFDYGLWFSVYRLSYDDTSCSDLQCNSITKFDKIQDIAYDCYGEFYDITVPATGNYLAGGLYHHNSGKTVAGAQKALLKVMAGESGMVVNPDLENFRLSTWQELRLWIPWSMVIPKQRYRKSEGWDVTRPFTMVFMNGAKMFCKGLKDPESARGSNVNWLWYDEGARDRTGLGWRIANFAVRVGDAPQSWITTTPKGSAHWLYDFFEKKEIPAEVWKIVEELEAKSGVKRELISSYHGTVRDNKENLDEMTYASYIMSAPSGYLRAQEVEGEYANEEGSLGDRKWFDNKVLPAVPDWISKQVRFWDLAATEKKMTPGKKNDPDETLGTLLGTDSETTKEVKRFCILDQKGGRWKWEQIERMVVEVAREDGSEVEICFEQEPASGGINQIEALKQHIQKELPYHHVSSLLAKKLGDRVLAANPWFGEAANGQFYMVKGLWNEDFLSQLDVFPNVAVHDDKVTSVTGARHKIAPIKKWSKVSFMAVSTPEKREN